MKKKIGLLAVILSILLTGTSYSANKKVVISFWHLDTQDDYSAEWQKMADAYTALHPSVRIEITVLENEAYKQRLPLAIWSGDTPDIFRSWGGGMMNEYADAGLLRDITKEVDSDWGRSIGKGALGVYSFKGKYYGAPYDMGAVGIWYNKRIFSKLRLAPFKTWTEFVQGVKKIKAAGIIPIALGDGDKWPGHFWWVYLALRLGGQEAFDKAYSREGAFTDPSFVKAGELLLDLVRLKPFQPGFLDAVYNDEAALVADGKAAMELMGQWAPYVQKANAANGKGLGEDLGWMPFPMVEGGNGNADIMGGGNGYILGKNAPDAAVDFLKFIISIKYNSLLAEQGRILPVVKGAEDALKDANMKEIVAAVSNAEYYQLYYDQYLPSDVGEELRDAVQGIFAGRISPKEAAQMIEKSAAANLK